MSNKKTHDSRKSLLTGASLLAAAAAALTAAPAMAQDAEEEEAIVVTGSRIARSDATSALPVTVVDSEAIQNAGVIGLGEILRQDPAISGGGFGQSNILSGGGAQTIDLRNLGPNRTLVLIDGQRYSLFTDSLQNEGQDLGLLPASMIERVEILRDGASTAYGADAVAGVVNFILRDDFEGMEASGFYSVSELGDAEQMRVGFVAGASSDRGNVIMAMEYQNRDNVPQTSRDALAQPFGGGISTNPFATIGSGIGGPQVRTTGGGLLQAFGMFGGDCAVPGTCTGTTDRYNYALDQDIVSSLEGYNIAFNATHEITSDIEWHGSAMYGSRFSEFGLAANPFSANAPSGPYLSGVRVGALETSNPYGQTVSITWRPVPYGDRDQSFNASQIWVSTGLTGSLADNYTWDITGTHSEVNSNGQTSVVPNIVRLTRLLNPSQCNADPVCSSPAIGPVANIANLFMNPTNPALGGLTQAQENYAFYTQSTNSRFITDTVQASLSGPLFTLPAGDVAFATGIEYRSEYGKATPDSVTQSGESIANATFPTEGDFDVFEIFGEIDIPLLRDVPGAQELTLNLQGRRSDFSNFGEAETWKVGLVWAPIDDLRIRANMGTSFRAPNVTELFSVGVQSFNNLADPCSTGLPGGASNGVYNDPLAVNCAALGVPLTYVQPAVQLRVLAGGNPNLQPETGETYTVGAVYQPSYFTPLTLTVDYWHLELEDAVVGGALQARLNTCYQTAPLIAFTTPGDPCFGLADRTASGVPTNLTSILTNTQGVSATSGVDFSIGLQFDGVGPGDLSLNMRTSWLEETSGGLFFGNVSSVGYLSGFGDTGYPEWRSTFDADYDLGDWRFSWQTRYQSEMADPACPGPSFVFNTGLCSGPNATRYAGYMGVDEYFIHDARVRFSADNYTLTLGVNNVADEAPPLAANTGNNTYPSLYDMIGRSFFIGVNSRF